MSKKSFLVMKELNPQLERNLKIVLTSPDYIQTVFAVRKNLSEYYRTEFDRAILNLDKNKSGREMLAIFKLDKIVFTDLETIKPLRQLYEKYYK